MKLRTNLLRVVLFMVCMVVSGVIIYLSEYFNVLGHNNLGVVLVMVLTLLTTSVVLVTPEYIKEKYNLV